MKNLQDYKWYWFLFFFVMGDTIDGIASKQNSLLLYVVLLVINAVMLIMAVIAGIQLFINKKTPTNG